MLFCSVSFPLVKDHLNWYLGRLKDLHNSPIVCSNHQRVLSDLATFLPLSFIYMRNCSWLFLNHRSHSNSIVKRRCKNAYKVSYCLLGFIFFIAFWCFYQTICAHAMCDVGILICLFENWADSFKIFSNICLGCDVRTTNSLRICIGIAIFQVI